jgi:hypothetical protein
MSLRVFKKHSPFARRLLHAFGARNDGMAAIPAVFSAQLLARCCLQSLIFGGKDETGDGAPEGLPLIVRFS